MLAGGHDVEGCFNDACFCCIACLREPGAPETYVSHSQCHIMPWMILYDTAWYDDTAVALVR